MVRDPSYHVDFFTLSHMSILLERESCGNADSNASERVVKEEICFSNRSHP